MLIFFSGVYEKAETKGRQTLLRNRANLIADFEALHHIHYWNHEPEPKYIYYFGQSKNFEEWYDTRKDDQGAIYKGFEEKSTFTKRLYKESNYDKRSIWVYDDNIESEIEKIKIMKNDLKVNIEYLTKKLDDSKNGKKKSDDEINEINKKIKEIENIEIKSIEEFLQS